MNKTILAIAILAIIAVTTPVFALPTTANAQQIASQAPYVMAKAEWLPNLVWDDDPSKPYLQVNPSTDWQGTKSMTYVMVAKDPDGIGDLVPDPLYPGTSLAFADVYHPDGSWKYQVAYNNIVSCYDNVGELANWVGYLQTAYNKGLIKLMPGTSITDIANNLTQCSAKIFWGTADISNCQMCGQFQWNPNPCPTCQNWTVSNFCTGYRINAYVFDKSGMKSQNMTNFFEFMCQAGIDTDFNMLDFETVKLQTKKWIEGDRIWNGLQAGPACGVAVNCVSPTFRNRGNMPLIGLDLLQNDMQFSYSGPSTAKDWNVRWDARIGEYTQPVVEYNPFETARVVGNVGLCALDKISFSIYVKKMETSGAHTGNITITAAPATWPTWFTPHTGPECAE
jgi:hypothetical protein